MKDLFQVSLFEIVFTLLIDDILNYIYLIYKSIELCTFFWYNVITVTIAKFYFRNCLFLKMLGGNKVYY